MVSKVYSCSVFGLNCRLVEIETDIDSGFQKVSIVGLPDLSINEAKDRIMSALKNSGYYLPRNKVTINLAPANLRKIGTHYDLPMAISILLSSGQINKFNTSSSLFIGELSLDGRVRGCNVALALAIFAKENGYANIFIPYINANEVSLINGINVYPVNTLKEVIDHINNVNIIKKFDNKNIYLNYLKTDEDDSPFDFRYIKGHSYSKRALEIAATGGHNILMYGSPGSGKTMLARSVQTILPKMTEKEIIEVSRIYSIAGLLTDKKPFIINRPFRSPHNSGSTVSILGGGSIAKPGEISLAHRGVLFLDEFPEFSREVIESLRQPLEDFNIIISRASGVLEFPAKFILVASCNPCPCGYLNDLKKPCTCSSGSILKYRNRISGPIIDRIDMHIEVPRVDFQKLASYEESESSEVVRKRVEVARDIQERRFLNTLIITNSEMKPKHIKQYCKLDNASLILLKDAIVNLNLSARGYTKVLKLSRTIADLDNSENIRDLHVAEALQFRKKEDNII